MDFNEFIEVKQISIDSYLLSLEDYDSEEHSGIIADHLITVGILSNLEFIDCGSYGSVYRSIKYPSIAVKITTSSAEYELAPYFKNHEYKHINKVYQIVPIYDENEECVASILVKDFIEYSDCDKNEEALRTIRNVCNNKFDLKISIYSLEELNEIAVESDKILKYLDPESDKLAYLIMSQYESMQSEISELMGDTCCDGLDLHCGNFGVTDDDIIKFFDVMPFW